MLQTDFWLELTDGSTTVRVDNKAPFGATGYGMDWDTGLKGWWDSPDNKVEMNERQAGNGAHNITEDMVLYSARTVTFGIYACATDREAMIKQQNALNKLLGKIVQITISDATQTTYAIGFIEVEWDELRHSLYEYQKATINVVCADPHRYAVDAQRWLLSPLSGTDGGLMFDDYGCMYVNPVQFYGETEIGNVSMLENNGTSTAYPTITVSGNWPNGVTLNFGDGNQLAYAGAIYYQNLVIDCLTRTASINGVDVTRNFTSRDFPVVEPGGSVRISCMSAGTGSVEVSVHDTYL